MNKKKIIYEIKKIKLDFFRDSRGDLSVFDFNNIPFNIKRVFSVKADKNEVRGNHAHKKCLQFMVCLNGRIKLKLDNGHKKFTKILSKPNSGILVPNNIWASQKYLENKSVMIVFCNRKYEKDDYINDYNKFLSQKFIKY